MAGVSNCNKLRTTGRQQWFGAENAPSLQTVSINGRIGETSSGIGTIVFNDQNGYHSQSGACLTYTHHIMFWLSAQSFVGSVQLLLFHSQIS